MSQKDISEKLLEAYDDVFADIVNVLLFDGRQVIKPSELEDSHERSGYKADGKLREQERDVVKFWKSGNIRLACLGIENQTVADITMPVRVLSYDAAEYRAQIKTGKQKEFFPVVTLVLYFGYKRHWDKPKNLLGQLHIPKELSPYVNDYKINLFEIAYLPEEKIKLFKSDFRAVADFFYQMRTTGNYVGSKTELVHVQETLQLLAVMTGNHRFEEIISEPEQTGGEIRTMCEAIDRIYDKGIEKGIEKGIKKGIEKGIEQGIEQGIQLDNLLFAYLLQNGLTEEALKATKSSTYKKQLFKKYKQSLSADKSIALTVDSD